MTPGEIQWYPTWHVDSGEPRTNPIPNHEFSGVIEAVGAAVCGLEKGSPVYGLNSWFIDGAAAEYCIAAPSEIAPKPHCIAHPEAAAVPISGLAAWQALFQHGKLKAGQKGLIHGGAGGVGSFAIQLAAWKGACVVTTTAAAKAAFVRSLGAKEVIDYQGAAFENVVGDADLVLDTVGGDTLMRSFKAIRHGGRVVTVVADAESQEEPAVKDAFFIVEANREQLVELANLIDAGEIRPVVSEVLPFLRAVAAYASARKKSSPGKLVLQVVTEK